MPDGLRLTGLNREQAAAQALASDDTLASDQALELLLARFLDCSLPLSEWTHAAHLSVGLCLLLRYGRAEAGERMRAAIRAYNEATGVGNSETRGYHETITLAWLDLIALYLAAAPAATPAAHCSRFLAGPWAARDTLLRFYRRETLFSTEARRSWTEPDQAPIALSES